MSTRSGMAALIARVQDLIDDAANLVFTDEQVQSALDRHKVYVRGLSLPLAPSTTVTDTGITWLDYDAGVGDWETDAVLRDATYAIVNSGGYTADYAVGHWTFSASKIPPLWVNGQHYDTYGAACDLLEMWADQLKLRFDFTTDQEQMLRSQQIDMVLKMAAKYAERMRPVTIPMVRVDDIAGG